MSWIRHCNLTLDKNDSYRWGSWDSPGIVRKVFTRLCPNIHLLKEEVAMHADQSWWKVAIVHQLLSRDSRLAARASSNPPNRYCHQLHYFLWDYSIKLKSDNHPYKGRNFFKWIGIKCRQVATWVPDMFSSFIYLSYKIANNLATTEARENVRTYLESFEFYNHFDVCLTKFENHQILLDKICHRILVCETN